MQEQILEELKKINQKINLLEDKINLLIENNKNIENGCSKMKEHIDFVENTYSSVRRPLNFIKNKIDYMMGNLNSQELPQITNSSNDNFYIQDQEQ